MGFIIIVLGIAYMFWVYISNADLKIEKIKAYLDRKKLNYVRHKKIKKPHNPNFEVGENIFTWLHYIKHHYEIDATDLEVNPIIVKAIFYQKVGLFRKSKVYFDIVES